jgi:hypothetical protein
VCDDLSCSHRVLHVFGLLYVSKSPNGAFSAAWVVEVLTCGCCERTSALYDRVVTGPIIVLACSVFVFLCLRTLSQINTLHSVHVGGGARGSIVGRGTMLQAGRSRV